MMTIVSVHLKISLMTHGVKEPVFASGVDDKFCSIGSVVSIVKPNYRE